MPNLSWQQDIHTGDLLYASSRVLLNGKSWAIVSRILHTGKDSDHQLAQALSSHPVDSPQHLSVRDILIDFDIVLLEDKVDHLPLKCVGISINISPEPLGYLLSDS
jgi:hypothetical protein